MPEPNFNEIIAKINSVDIDVRVQSIYQLGRFREPKVLDLLLDIAISDDVHQARSAAEHVIAVFSKLPEFIDLLLRKLIEVESMEQKELIARILQGNKDLRVVHSIVATSGQYQDNIHLRESAVWVLLSYDRARAKEYCSKLKIDILVAEDEYDIRDLICFTLMFGGWKVIGVHNGEAVCTFAEICAPSLVLMDVRMPRMTGYEACKVIKADQI